MTWSTPLALSRANVARAKQVERLMALLRALVHRFDGLEGELDTQGSGALAVGLVFAFPGQFYHWGTPCAVPFHQLGSRVFKS